MYMLKFRCRKQSGMNFWQRYAIMGMGIKHGNTVRVEVEGEDEAEAAAQIEAFFKANL